MSVPADHGGTVRTSSALALFTLVLLAGLAWAKWWPYALKTHGLLDSRSWSGAPVLNGDGAAGPSLREGWEFTVAYGQAVWKALAAALVIAASLDALVPRRWLVAALSRPRGPFVAGLLAVPCMMCTCCTAPLANSLRRSGARRASVLAYWLGNPTLNPAVLVFLALVAPWQWFAVRLVMGLVLVFGVTVLVDRLVRGDDPPGRIEAPAEVGEPLREAPRRFLRTLGRMALTLVPEYAVVVFAIGTFQGWLFPFGSHTGHWGVLAVVLCAVLGTLVVVPTAGEIPVLQGLSAAGAGSGVVGTLLLVLPAISLPSMVMVGKQLTWRFTLCAAVAVAVTGLAAGLVLRAVS